MEATSANIPTARMMAARFPCGMLRTSCGGVVVPGRRQGSLARASILGEAVFALRHAPRLAGMGQVIDFAGQMAATSKPLGRRRPYALRLHLPRCRPVGG